MVGPRITVEARMINQYAGKKLLLLGGVRTACEIIDEAKRMGVVVCVGDNREDSPGKRIADCGYMVDVTDVEAVVKLCDREKIDGIITGHVDMLLPYCQQICEKTGKPFWGNADNIQMSINKEEFKTACEKTGVPVVPGKMATKEDYREVLSTVTPPVVIKPVDNSGSRGVCKCYKSEDLIHCAEQALSFSKRGEILIEEAMNPHKEFSVYYMMNHGRSYLTGMGDRYVSVIDDNTAPTGLGMLFPSVYLDEWKEKMDGKIKKFLADNEMNDGFVFIQGFYKEGSFYIHEIGYRINGGYSYKIIEHFSHYNQIQELIKFSLSGDMDKEELEKSDPNFKGYGMIVTASLAPGVIGKIAGVSEVERTEGVLQFFQLHDEGDSLLGNGTTAQVFAYILCAVKTETEMKELVQTIAEKLSVTNINGGNMLNPLVDPSKIVFKRC